MATTGKWFGSYKGEWLGTQEAAAPGVASILPAAGVSTTSTLTGSGVGITAASMVPADGVTTTSTFASSSVMASIAIATAGLSSAQELAASSVAAAIAIAAAGLSSGSLTGASSAQAELSAAVGLSTTGTLSSDDESPVLRDIARDIAVLTLPVSYSVLTETPQYFVIG